MHDVIAGMDNTSSANIEKKWTVTSKRGNRDRIRWKPDFVNIEALTAIWLTVRNDVGIPERALRSMIEASAKTQRQGAQVRQGLRVLESHFEYDTERYGITVYQLAKSAQFTVPVRVQRSTIQRTRAKIDTPWTCRFMVDATDELVDKESLTNWLSIGGRRIGLGDWRPATSGAYGTFSRLNLWTYWNNRGVVVLGMVWSCMVGLGRAGFGAARNLRLG